VTGAAADMFSLSRAPRTLAALNNNLNLPDDRPEGRIRVG